LSDNSFRSQFRVFSKPQNKISLTLLALNFLGNKCDERAIEAFV